jgi:hypothetical protein
VERVTGIEPALSSWESMPSGPVTWPDQRGGLSASDRQRPLVAGVNGPAILSMTWTVPRSQPKVPTKALRFLGSTRPPLSLTYPTRAEHLVAREAAGRTGYLAFAEQLV